MENTEKEEEFYHEPHEKHELFVRELVVVRVSTEGYRS